jgi:hypothetical protein
MAVDDVMERLRASKAERDGILSREGRAAGESWARHKAGGDELELLALGPTVRGTGWDRFLDGATFKDARHRRIAVQLAEVILDREMGAR